MRKDTDILIVEENSAEAEHLKHILEQHEYHVSIEHDVKNALASIRQNKPQIVISAVLFAGTDGYALCREIKSDDEMKSVAVILLTSLSDATDIIHGMECGADNFITKPYDEELLISRIKFILLNRELRRGADTQVGVEVIFQDEKYSITPERQQIVDLLLSTYETAVQKNIELTRVQTELNRLNNILEEQCAERTAQLTEEIIERRTAETSLTKEAAFVELLQIAAVAANEADTIEDAAQICLDRVCELTKWQLGHLNLLVKDSDEIVPTTLWCICDHKHFEKFIRETEKLRWSKGVGLPGRVLETGKAVWIADVSAETYFIRTKAAEKVGIKSAFAFPIFVNGKVNGVLEFFSVVAEEPDEKLLEVMTSIGIQLGQVIERKRAEMSLQTSEDRYRDLVENSHDLICTHDLEGNILSVNQTAVKALGYDLNTLLNQNVQSVLAPEFQNGFNNYIAKLKKEGVAGGLMTVKSAGGEMRVWEYNNTLRTEGVEVPVVRGMAMDVTERRQAESKLRASEEWLRAILDGSRDGIVIEDDGKLVYVNEAYAKSLQYDQPEELMGKDVSFVLPPDEAERMTEYGRRRLRGEQVPTIYEFKGKRKDGNLIEVEGAVSTSVIGGKKYIMTAIRDITERKLAEEKLKESEGRYRALVTANAQVVWIANADGEAQFTTSAWQELTGQSYEETQGWGWLDALHPESREQNERKWRQAFESRSIYDDEQAVRVRDGSYSVFHARGVPIFEEDGQVREWVGTLTDINQRKQAENSLRASERRFRELVDILPIAVYVCDSSGLIESYNQRAVELWGRKPKIKDAADSFCGSYKIYSIDGVYLPHAECPMAQFLRTGIRISNEEIVIERPDGSRRTAIVNVLPRRDEQGLLTGAINCLVDITERKLADEALKESERRYRQLGEGIWHQVWTAQPNGKLDYINGGTVEFFGRTEKHLLDEGWQNVVHPDDLPMCVERWTRSLQTGENYEVQFRLQAANGNYRWHLGRATAGRDAAGEIIKWFGTNTDINKQKLAEEELKMARFHLETALDAGAIATWSYDIINNRVAADKNMARLYSISPDDAAGGPIENYVSVIHPDDRQLTEKDLARVISGETHFELNYRIVKSDGAIRWVETRGRIERDESGTAINMPGVAIDITVRKEAEKALLESEERLQQSQKMEAIGTLTGGVAHDFNNLLTAILGNTQLAQRKLAHDDPIRLRLTEVADAGNRAAELTSKLFAFSRRQHLEKRAVDLNDTIAEIVKLLERIIGEDVEVCVKYADDLQTVFADAGQIEQVVMNLVVNARDAMPEGGKVTIETSNVKLDESYCRRYPYVVPGRYVQIRVSDTGSGIDEETQARIFEPFFTTKEVGKGTGLGLSMAYGIVKQHDGHISLYSELETGTTFKVYLPTDKKTVEEKVPIQMTSFLGGNETILVAEDEEPLRNLAKDTLEELGYTVLLAKDGAEAVKVFNANRGRINLFLTDVVMPRMGGAEAYERIRESGENVPLIFMTGYSAETVQSRFVKSKTTAEKLGAVIIQKPYTLEELGRIVREVLDKN